MNCSLRSTADAMTMENVSQDQSERQTDRHCFAIQTADTEKPTDTGRPGKRNYANVKPEIVAVEFRIKLTSRKKIKTRENSDWEAMEKI